MRYVALRTHHEIKAIYPGGHSIIFQCGISITSARTGGKSKAKQITGTEGKQHELESTDEGTEARMAEFNTLGKLHRPKKPCRFNLVFTPTKNGLWALKKDCNVFIPIHCHETPTPNICMNGEFIATLISRHLPSYCTDRRRYRITQLCETFEREYWFFPNKQTLYKGWNKAVGVDEESVVLQNRKVEDYLRRLNRNGQYGVLLHFKWRIGCSKF